MSWGARDGDKFKLQTKLQAFLLSVFCVKMLCAAGGGDGVSGV